MHIIYNSVQGVDQGHLNTSSKDLKAKAEIKHPIKLKY